MSKFFNIFKLASRAPEITELTEFLSKNESFKQAALKTHNLKLKAMQELDKAAFPENYANKKYLENEEINKTKINKHQQGAKQKGQLIDIQGTFHFQEEFLDQKAVILNFHTKCKESVKLGEIFKECIQNSNGWSILRINVDDEQNQELKYEYNVKQTPQTDLIVDEKEVQQMIGYNEVKLMQILQIASMRY